MQVLSLTPNTNGIKASHRKENKFMYSYIGIAIKDGEIKESVDCRIYGTDSRNYCCIWIHGNNIYTSGSDYAGGWGYHRPSAAAQGAINAAGIKLSEAIDGRGDSALESAVLAITQHLYPDCKCHVIKAHG